jgi:peptide/nickel transport system ATP-binding protein
VARLVVRLIEPDRGTVRLGPTDLTTTHGKALRQERRRIQIVFQDPFASLNPRRKVGDIITDGPIAHGADPEAARQRARDLLGLVGLNASAMARFPHEFSGGQRQRIGIARALAYRSRSPGGGRGRLRSRRIRAGAESSAYSKTSRRGLACPILFISHDLRVAAQICDRVAVMQRGVIVETADTHALFTDPQHPYTRELLAAVPSLTPSADGGRVPG